MSLGMNPTMAPSRCSLSASAASAKGSSPAFVRAFMVSHTSRHRLKAMLPKYPSSMDPSGCSCFRRKKSRFSHSELGGAFLQHQQKHIEQFRLANPNCKCSQIQLCSHLSACRNSTGIIVSSAHSVGKGLSVRTWQHSTGDLMRTLPMPSDADTRVFTARNAPGWI